MSTVNMNTMHMEEGILKGAHRSRFSFHFNLLRRRRWILVQLVSVPVDSNKAQPDSNVQRAADAQHAKPSRLGQLVDQYQVSQMTRRLI